MTQSARQNSLPEPWRSLAAQAGGVGLLAKALGVSRQALHLWVTGRMGMSPRAKEVFDGLMRDLKNPKNTL